MENILYHDYVTYQTIHNLAMFRSYFNLRKLSKLNDIFMYLYDYQQWLTNSLVPVVGTRAAAGIVLIQDNS